MDSELKEMIFRWSVAHGMREDAAEMKAKVLAEIRATIKDPAMLQDKTFQEQLKSIIRIAADKYETFKASGYSKGKHNKSEAAKKLAAARKVLGNKVGRWYKSLVQEITGSSFGEAPDECQTDDNASVSSGNTGNSAPPQDVTQHENIDDSDVDQDEDTQTRNSAATQDSSTEVIERTKRSRPPPSVTAHDNVVPLKKRKDTKVRHNSHDGLLQLSDFKSITTVKKHDEDKVKLQELANQMSTILKRFGPAYREWFIDGEDEDHLPIRFLALKPTFIENISFRKYKKVENSSATVSEVVLGTDE